MHRKLLLVAFCCALPFVLIAGCEQSQPQVASTEPPVVPVAKPIEREVTEYVDFTGRTDAKDAVDIRARVTGYLVQIPFEEGAEVKKGDLLFEIDPRPYHAQYDQAVSQVELNEASLKLARTTLARDTNIQVRSPGAVSQQQLDQDQAAVEEADARLKSSQASTKVYKLNVDFTKVTSPIDGQVSRYYYTLGNLINQDQTLLTTVVSLTPMYAYFDLDEPTLLRIRTAVNKEIEKVKQSSQPLKEAGSVLVGMPLLMGLQGEEGFPHEGKINFVNNQVNSATGTISVRGIFDNPKPPGGARLISPGMYARIRLPIGHPHPALLIVDRAITSDQGIKSVLVVDEDNKAQTRRITTGPVEPDGLRVVEKGLKPDDRVIVGALQQVRPKMEVRPEDHLMTEFDQRKRRVASPEGSPAETKPAGDPAGKKVSEGGPAKTEPAGDPAGKKVSAQRGKSKR
jgi:membrane fusion protein, multidrug efflux system